MATSTNMPTILKYLSDDNTDDYMVNQNIEGPPHRAKKRRLDHLSWEEKMQRKKLKNRVAAQTSRDRKKAKFEQMESAIQELFNKNEVLLAECEKLRAANERLQSENAELHQRLQEQPRPEVSCPTCHQNRTVVCEAESGSAESLLRPRGTATHTAAALDLDNPVGHNTPVVGTASKQALFRAVLACLLYRTFSTNLSPTTSTSMPSNSLPSPYSKISPKIWRMLLEKQLIKYVEQYVEILINMSCNNNNTRNQPLIEKIFQEKWWGRHQSSWNPPVNIKC